MTIVTFSGNGAQLSDRALAEHALDPRLWQKDKKSEKGGRKEEREGRKESCKGNINILRGCDQNVSGNKDSEKILSPAKE